MEGKERITVRLPADDMVLLTELVRRGRYQFESDAVEDAVSVLLRSYFTEEEKTRILKERRMMQKLDLNDFIAGEDDADKILVNVIVRGLQSDRKDERWLAF